MTTKKTNDVKSAFEYFFAEYKHVKEKDDLTFVITSLDRPGNPRSNPHALPGNAMDFTLRTNGKYAHIREYNELFAYMMDNWPFRAGIDNTWIGEKKGNVHIHIDLGENRPEEQDMPYFFKENNGRFTNRIETKEQI